MNIQQIQDRLLAIYAQGTEGELYQLLFEDYHAVYNEIWTPEFRYRMYILDNPHSTMEQAFLRGVRVGWMDGFDSGYDEALGDMHNGVAV